jgi:hypothetical protein
MVVGKSKEMPGRDERRRSSFSTHWKKKEEHVYM